MFWVDFLTKNWRDIFKTLGPLGIVIILLLYLVLKVNMIQPGNININITQPYTIQNEKIK